MTHETGRREFLKGAFVLGGLTLFSSPLLTACAGTPAEGGGGGSPVRGGTLTVARAADILAVDPAHIGDNEAIWMVSNVYERLYRTSTSGTAEPWLATAHTLSADRLTWTFTLRDGVKFADGSPMTSADVKFSIDRTTKSKDTGWINVAIKSVAAPDPKTVVITTKSYTDMRGVLSFYGNGIVPDKFGGRSEQEFFKKPVGTGPFVMTSWAVGREVVLDRNEHYWQSGKPYLDKVVLTTVSNDSTRTLQLRGQQADVVESPAWSQLDELKSQNNITVQSFDSTLVYFLLLNTTTPHLSDLNVRQAISHAVDRPALIKLALFGHAQAAGSMFAPKWPGYDQTLTAPQRDVAAAKAALSKSKYPDGFELTYSIDGGDAVQSAVAQSIQTNLAEIGIKVKISQFDPTTLWSLIDEGKYEICHRKLSLDIPDTAENVPTLSDPAVGGYAKVAGYNNPAVVDLGKQSIAMSDPGKQTAAYADLQHKLNEELPYVPLYYVPWSYAMSQRVHDFEVPSTGDYHLEKTWLSR
ncbi:ABC transporter substrate-binding protein [Kribbella solani]|uniref:Peptide/nickel transport system substrate-binding protein n=1 Tax=Kribbella solani TaxID=236067 RepID=A0A841DN57_9ACTN|nr:ABC transporter substrate-binding protein [Kribbella solani]MBB5979972.1 peptide/nickel transport system substrate-binding protein [Kribbella solani]